MMEKKAPLGCLNYRFYNIPSIVFNSLILNGHFWNWGIP